MAVVRMWCSDIDDVGVGVSDKISIGAICFARL